LASPSWLTNASSNFKASRYPLQGKSCLRLLERQRECNQRMHLI